MPLLHPVSEPSNASKICLPALGDEIPLCIFQLMYYHSQLTRRTLKLLIDRGEIRLGGNSKLKIYGTLSCKSGKRMKIENRVFFRSEREAINEGYRPCGHCLKTKYLRWKNALA